MAGDDTNSLIQYQEQLAAKRVNFDSWWQDVAFRVMPAEARFTTVSEIEGQKHTERLFDPTAVTANERFAAVMSDLNTPRTQRWHVLKPEDNAFEDDQEVKVYLERLTDALFTQRYRPRANFAAQKDLGYLMIGAFGNTATLIDEDIGFGARYKCIPTREIYWAENHQGMIDTLYRRFEWDAIAAAKRFGNRLPAKIFDAASKTPYQCFEFIHCVRPNEDSSIRDPLTGRPAPYASYYVSLEGRQMIEAGFYSSWPYGIGRYTLSGGTYARSPAMSCWPSILTLNEEKKTVLRAGQKEVDPPILLQEDGVLEAFDLRPGALNYGGANGDGAPLVLPFKTGANIPLGLELMQLERGHIEDAFLVTVFKILAENPQMTATQVLEIAQQKAILLAPVTGRTQSEDLGPMIRRELDLLARDSKNAWIHEEMPDALRERGTGYQIEYTSPLARAMRAQDGLAIQRTWESVGTVAPVKPEVLDVIDFDESVRELAEINGMPAKLIRSPDQVDAIRQARGQQQQQQNVLQAAPLIAQTAKTAAEADQIRTGTR